MRVVTRQNKDPMESVIAKVTKLQKKGLPFCVKQFVWLIGRAEIIFALSVKVAGETVGGGGSNDNKRRNAGQQPIVKDGEILQISSTLLFYAQGTGGVFFFSVGFGYFYFGLADLRHRLGCQSGGQEQSRFGLLGLASPFDRCDIGMGTSF